MVAGRLTIQLRDRDVELGPGEALHVPRGVEHCPRADDEAHVLLIEAEGDAEHRRLDRARTPRPSRARLAQTAAAAPRPAASRSCATRSVRSQVKSASGRPKWPYAAVFA